MLSSDPKSRQDLSLIALGKCPFPTKTSEIHEAYRSSVGSRKQLILSCLHSVAADSEAPVTHLHRPPDFCFFQRWTRGNKISQSFLLTARIITKYSLERFLSICGEKISKAFLKFCKLISNLILGQIISLILTNQNIKIGRRAWRTRDHGEKSQKQLSSLPVIT